MELKIHISNSPVLLRGGEMGQLLWETVWQLLKQLNAELPCDPAIPLPEMKTHECSELSVTDRLEEQPKYPSIDECVNKMCCFHTMEYYVAIKRNEETDTCYDLDDPGRHAEGKQLTTKVIYYTIPLMRTSRKGKSVETESRLAVA